MFLKNFISINICLTTVRVKKIQSFSTWVAKKLFGKMKDEFGGVIVDEFVGLKSKIKSMKKIDGKESNTAKGVNTVAEFNEFKDVLFNKKILDTKWEEFEVESIN